MKKEKTSYEDLLRLKQDLKYEISDLESEIKNNKILKLSSSFLNEESIKEPLFESLSSLNLKDLLLGPIGKLLSTFLMSNKISRKYFVPFVIIKELIPFVLDKIGKIVDQNDLAKKESTH